MRRSSVFDPTCGSGTALRAAESLGATRVLGLERDSGFAQRGAAGARKRKAEAAGCGGAGAMKKKDEAKKWEEAKAYLVRMEVRDDDLFICALNITNWIARTDCIIKIWQAV